MAGSNAYTYQWYENTVNNNTGGTPIPGATLGISYTLQNTTVGITFTITAW